MLLGTPREEDLMGALVNDDNYARAEVAFQVDRLITMMGGETRATASQRLSGRFSFVSGRQGRDEKITA
jgi:hypothetical protein